MLKSKQAANVFKAAVAGAFFIAAGAAQAQATPAPAASNEGKRCETGDSAKGNGGEFNPDSSRSACSLANGFINFGARTNDGVGGTPEFNNALSEPALERPSFNSNSHRLASQQNGGAMVYYGNGGNLLPGNPNYHFGSRDFTYAQEEPAIEGRGYAAGTRIASGEVYEPLIASARSNFTAADGSGGSIGGGGASGGFDRSGGGTPTIDTGTPGVVVPPIPAVPEPETYAMLLAGLGLVGFAARRRKNQAAAA